MFMLKDVVKKEQVLRLDWICWITEVELAHGLSTYPIIQSTTCKYNQQSPETKSKKPCGQHPSRETRLYNGKQNSPQLPINKDCHPEINRFQRKINII